jgi:hypothetical protein
VSVCIHHERVLIHNLLRLVQTEGPVSAHSLRLKSNCLSIFVNVSKLHILVITPSFSLILASLVLLFITFSLYFMSFYLPLLLYSCFIYLFLPVSVALSQLSPSSFTQLLTDYLPVNPFYIGSSETLSLRSVTQRNADESTLNEIHMPYQSFNVAQQHARV